jgi:hypothetical protein
MNYHVKPPKPKQRSSDHFKCHVNDIKDGQIDIRCLENTRGVVKPVLESRLPVGVKVVLPVDYEDTIWLESQRIKYNPDDDFTKVVLGAVIESGVDVPVDEDSKGALEWYYENRATFVKAGV